MKVLAQVEVWDGGELLYTGRLLDYSTFNGVPCGIIHTDRGFLEHCYLRCIKVLNL